MMKSTTHLLHLSLNTTAENLTGIVVYEVIRIIDGKPLFLQEHLKRLEHSAQLRLPFIPDANAVKTALREMITRHHLTIGNVEIQINHCQEILIKIIPHFYPTTIMYSEGVCLGTMVAERQNPNAKEKNLSLRDRANELIQTQHYYEMLLVNQQGEITEGSRSNVFFIKDQQVYTSPITAVLQGITREKIIDICHEQSIILHETNLPLSQMATFEAAFMTGTSPAVLPIQKIDQQVFSVHHELTDLIRKSYQQMVEEDMQHFRWTI
ncbi:MAG: aminotransferase class IV [Bacteroidales bacterium]|nr:aminotransferase class IV [Bacteroidales bacterium]